MEAELSKPLSSALDSFNDGVWPLVGILYTILMILSVYSLVRPSYHVGSRGTNRHEVPDFM